MGRKGNTIMLKAIVIEIDELYNQLTEDLLSMNHCKYSANEFLNKVFTVARDKELDPADVFTDRRMYYGENAVEEYTMDCKILIECLEKIKLYSEMSEGFKSIYDLNNTFAVSHTKIVVIKNGAIET